MKQRIKALAALALALSLSLGLALPAFAAGTGPAAVNAVAERTISDVMSYSGASQMSWAVWQDGTILSSGSGTRELDSSGVRREAAGDIYCIGSVSKIFTAVAVMQLVEAGRVELDKPVTAYLPAFKMADPRYKDITVRMLLNHSSGLMGSSFSSALLLGDASELAADTLLQRLSTQRLKADPGAYSVYCNDGFTLAQLVVEAVTETEFMDYLRDNIFKPAGLTETWSPASGIELRRAPVYQEGVDTPLPKECLGAVGTAGLYATAEDVARFGGALTGNTLLKKSSRDAMAAPEYKSGLWPSEGFPDTLAFGLGWDHVERYPFAQNGITALVKGGDIGHYHAGLVVLPEHKLTAAVLTCGGSSTYNEMAASQLLMAALREKGVEVSEIRFRLPAASRADLPQELLAGAGYYGAQTVTRVELAGDGTLTMSQPSEPDLPARTYYYHSDGTFRNGDGTSALRMVKGDNGRTYLYQWSFNRASSLGYLPVSCYIAEKLTENAVDPAVQAKWEEAVSDTVFLPMNERWSSETYVTLNGDLKALGNEAAAKERIPGYVGSLRIVDETHARYELQIPGSAGRDGYDVTLRRDAKGALWLDCSNGTVGMDLAAVPELSAGREGGAVCTIQPDGYARWYRVGEGTAGKTLSVQVPEDAGYWVYDSSYHVIGSSLLWGNKAVRLHQGSLIVFAGDPGAKFALTFS